MKRVIESALASGLALLIAGCASQGGGASTGSTGTSTEASAPAVDVPTPTAAKNFNLTVKCPGVHYEKTHGWTNQQIMQQEVLDESDIPACEAWFQAQPKGYVPPPPPPGVAPAPGAKSTSAAASGAADNLPTL